MLDFKVEYKSLPGLDHGEIIGAAFRIKIVLIKSRKGMMVRSPHCLQIIRAKGAA